ncbi:biliverdin-producing heme oxygenase [Microbulbifer litoralis]|uniref:biliverdin-producing heme oxygenase n=1 Tax=Microbulbifer litoralis TaxID=2933965 RepID=UPI002028D480|nr:biliverdin-producing heme oxygenase [Microbulbifer sp. GX H0434]
MNIPHESRSKRLMSVTDEQHERLHVLVAQQAPFSSLAAYGHWLDVQFRFQYRIASLYHWPALGDLLPELPERGRLAAVEADLRDLGRTVPASGTLAEQPRQDPEAWGWLFVSEGSNLGAAILLKRARALGLSEQHGARHLAGAPEGRARHWRAFTAVFDALSLDAAQEARLQAAAKAAFAYFEVLLQDACAQQVQPEPELAL